MRAAEPSVALWSASAWASTLRTASSAISSPCGSGAGCGSTPSCLRASARFSQASAPTQARSSPVITASDRIGAADSSAVRSAPTRTNVPVASLKSSAMRPRNTSPAFGSPGSASDTRSPDR